jgi:hypothetical protein
MTDTLLAPEARLNVALFSAGANMPGKPKFRFEKKLFEGATEAADVLIVEDLPVFRSGTFRDSMGYQHTWESIHMDQMAAHFKLLKDRHIFEDVPTRKGHPGFLTNAIDEVIGYHTALRTETRNNPVSGEDEVYLLATFEVMDPDAIGKISSGLWRNVSAEVGSYLSNNETEFWPVYQGVAYVDIPAVEGLKSFNNHNGVGKTFSLMLDTDKEDAVTAPNLPNPNPAPPAAGPVTPTDLAYHGRANFTFSIGGRQTNDFSQVQAHITQMEAQNSTYAAAAAEAKIANRKDYIKGLAEGATPKILASQIPNIEGYALKMDDESWTAFQAAHDGMPALSSVSQHGNATTGGQQVNPSGSTPVGGQPTGDAELDTAIGILEMHSRSGMKADKIKATPSYAKVKAAKPDHPLLAKIPA